MEDGRGDEGGSGEEDVREVFRVFDRDRAVLVSQSALCAKELVGDRSVGPAMMHPSEALGRGSVLAALLEPGVKRALVVGIGIQILQQGGPSIVDRENRIIPMENEAPRKRPNQYAEGKLKANKKRVVQVSSPTPYPVLGEDGKRKQFGLGGL